MGLRGRLHRRLWSLSVAGLALLLAGPVLAAAASPTVRFTYSRGAGASDCPDEDVVRAGVAGRLGYEPFEDGAERLISTTVARVGRTLGATIQIWDAAGVVQAERKLASSKSDCTELAATIELAVSIAIDPLGSRAPRAPAPELVPDPPPSPPAPPPQPPPAPPAAIIVVQPAIAPALTLPPPAPVTFQTTLGAVGALGSAPAPALGITLQASARRGPASLGLEGRSDFGASRALRVGQVRTSLLAGSFLACWHVRRLAGCALAIAGAMRASGRDLVDPQQVSMSFLALGARLSLDLPLSGVFLLRIHGDLMAPLTETVLRVSDEPVWTSPPISAVLGVGLAVRFL